MRTRVTITLLSALLVVLAAGPGLAADTARIQGGTRVETSVEIAYDAGVFSHRIYLARSDKSADALAAGALRDGPVVLVPSCGEPPEYVTNFIASRNTNPTVTALGGAGAICDEMLAGVAGDDKTDRIAGSTRFDTAAKIAQRAFPDGAGEVYLANAYDSPDPVAGGVLRDGPMLLVPPAGTVPQVVLDAIQTLDPTRVVALGGAAAVSDEVLAAAAAGRSSGRIAGTNRFETAVAISRYLWGDVPEQQTSQPLPASRAYLARSDVFADALAAGSYADGPILLVPSCGGLPPAVEAELARLVVKEVVALGGQGAICQQTLNAASNVAPELGVHLTVHRRNFLGGATFQTSELVPAAGFTITTQGVSTVLDEAGQAQVPLPPSGNLASTFSLTNTSPPFRDITDGTLSCRGTAAGGGYRCEIDLYSFSMSLFPTYPDNDTGNIQIYRATTVRLDGPIQTSASSELRPDGTFVFPMFTNLPGGEYDIYFTAEGCTNEFKQASILRVADGQTTGDGFGTYADTGCATTD